MCSVPGGSLGLIWNRIDQASPWVTELVAIMRGVNTGQVGHGADLSVLPRAGFDRPVRQTWRFRQPIDRSALVDLVASRSYVMGLAENERSMYSTRSAPSPLHEIASISRTVCEVWRAFRQCRS